ncbi:hypothetical protein ABI59_00685 [Acidobacteria bacterium Mor1]|nr:hypothetical protein ABI59_00685 [Acidobacteria bacterium Mor1]
MALALAALLFGGGAWAEESLRLLRVTPSGESAEVGRQIVLQFDRAMVPLGRMDRRSDEVPVRISPDPGCAWRWISTSALSCELSEDRPLRPATRYTVQVAPGWAALDGSTLPEQVVHRFATRRPEVRHHWFERWEGPGQPVVRLTFNQPVDEESLPEGVVFETGGNRVRCLVERVEGSDTSFRVRPETPLAIDRRYDLRTLPGILSREGELPSDDEENLARFSTFPEFRFLGISCRNKGRSSRMFLDQGDLEKRRCDPLSGVELLFSAPPTLETLRTGLGVDPDLTGGEDRDPWAGMHLGSSLYGIRRDHEYGIYLPQVLRADELYRLRAAAGALQDEFGRGLAGGMDFVFRTNNRRPRLRLNHTVSVLESDVETHLPVVVTNLAQLHLKHRVHTVDGTGPWLEGDRELPEVRNVAYRHPIKVRELLGEGGGAVTGRIRSTPKTDGSRHEGQWFFTQVTPFQVHVKLGHYNSLVWVTDMQTGKPVSGARVELMRAPLSTLQGMEPVGFEAVTDDQGFAILAGTEQIDPERLYLRYWKQHSDAHLFVQVTRDRSMALLPLGNDFRVRGQGVGESWIPENAAKRHGHIEAWGFTAQGVYRAGDTLQYKLYVREEGNETLRPALPGNYSLTIRDPLGKPVQQRDDLVLDPFGSLSGELKLPESATLGWYVFELSADYTDDRSWQPLRVLVTDFTPSPFKVHGDLDGERYQAGDRVRVDTSAALHAGGPYVDAPTRVTAQVRASAFEVDDPRAEGFFFDTGYSRPETVHRSEGRLDGQGRVMTEFEVRTDAVIFGTLTVESAVRDDRGKYVTSRSQARYAARDRFPGLRQQDWVLQAGTPAEVDVLVADAAGALVEGHPVEVIVEHRETKAARVKGAGNAYTTRYEHRWVEADRCDLTSAAEAVECRFTPDGPGYYRISASLEDSDGHGVKSVLHRWAAGSGYVLWEERPGHHLDVLPEAGSLKVGDTARYLVKNPFPGATALISVERYGVIDHWTQVLEDSTAVIEVPIKKDYLPGFYLSVVVVSPRVTDAPADGNVDLGKPAFRIGYARTEVRDPFKELAIEARADREVYKPGEEVTVEIEASPRRGNREPVQLAVAVLDEAVLDLVAGGTDSFDPYRNFYELRALDLWNYNTLLRLIGIQKFEQKGANPGGGGGPDPSMRSDFRFVAYWNPAVEVDAEGKTVVRFEVPDNLTGWRVLVVGATASDRFGLGQGSFKVNRPTEIRPALPNQVSEGDRFTARFTVMNRTEAEREIEVRAEARGAVTEPASITRETLVAAPYKRYDVSLSVAAGEREGEIEFSVTAGDSLDADGLVATVPVLPAHSIDTGASYGTTVEEQVLEAVRYPDGIRTDVGSLQVELSPTVISGVEGAFDYIRRYPYHCWEQKLTKGVMAAHYRSLREYLPPDFVWVGGDDLTQKTLDLAADHQTPGGGMAYYVAEDRYASAYLSAYTALAFGWLEERGYTVPPGVTEKLHDYLLRLLRRDVFPGFYSAGMSSTVRAVALAALAPTGKLTLDDLRRYRHHADRMDLFGKAHYLQALQALNDEPFATRLQDQILSHANETGGKLTLQEQLDNGYARILHSSNRTQCAVLSALARRPVEALREAGADGIPFKMVKALVAARSARDRWENTQENVFCMNALVDYSRAFEQVDPKYRVRVKLGKKSLGRASLEGYRGASVQFERPIRDGDAGRETELQIERKGRGRLYYALRMQYALKNPPRDPVMAGVEVHREYSVERDGRWILLDDSAEVARGELVRVDLYVSLPAPRHFLVVDDPIPGGLEPVNRDLATASQFDADKAEEHYPSDAFFYRHDDWCFYESTRWSFYHRELGHDRAVFYSDYLPAGRYHLSYVAQAIAPGSFRAMPTHAEEMYAPDVYGKGPLRTLEVVEGGAR